MATLSIELMLITQRWNLFVLSYSEQQGLQGPLNTVLSPSHGRRVNRLLGSVLTRMERAWSSRNWNLSELITSRPFCLIPPRECHLLRLSELRSRDVDAFIMARRIARRPVVCNCLLSLKEFRLRGHFFRVAKVAQANAHQTEALMGTQIHAISQRQGDAGQFIARNRWVRG